jgi:GT2 family glycosyltransferase
MNDSLASIIIVNWNGARFIEKCLFSLKEQSYRHFEVIFVDNASGDDSLKIVEKNNLNFVKIIENPANLGFAKANNIGIQVACGEYIVTLNNDTQPDCRWLEELVCVAEGDSKIGMCASKIFFSGYPKVIDSVGVNIYPDGMSKQRGHLEIDTGQYNKVEEILLPSACAALYRRQMLEEIGLFDEDFFAYCEDTDLGLRGRLAGWKAVLVPTAIVYHFYSGTGRQHPLLQAYLVERNHFWVAVKNFPLNRIITLPMYLIYRYLVQVYCVFRYRAKAGDSIRDFSKFKLFMTLIESWMDALVKLPLMWKKRKTISSYKKVGNHDIQYWFDRYRSDIRNLVIKDEFYGLSREKK